MTPTSYFSSLFSRLSQILCGASILLVAASCSPIVEARGHVGIEDMIAEIKPQQTTREEVLQKLGSPTSTSDFGTQTWYYIYAKREVRAFLKPEVVEQKVVSIEFDAGETVSKIDTYGLEDTKKIDSVKRVTPTEGHSLGFVEQILGNIGRFNKSTKTTPKK